MASIDFDAVLDYLGAEGRYQTVLYYLLCIPATVPAAFLAFNQVFLSATPAHWCRVPELANLTVDQRKFLSIPLVGEGDETKYSECSMYRRDYNQILHDFTAAIDKWPLNGSTSLNKSSLDPPDSTTDCIHGWEYETSQYDATLVTEMNLVCNRKWLPPLCTTLFYVGSLFGNLLFGWIADKWGRRVSFLLMIYMAVTLSVATAFSPNYTVYTALRMINGLTFPSLFQIPYILVMELVGPEFRTFAGTGISMFFGLSLALLAGLAHILRHWFHLALATSLPFIPLFGYFWVVPESPRWLLSQNRIDEAEAIVQRIARINKISLPINYLRSLQQSNGEALRSEEWAGDNSLKSTRQVSNGTMLELMRYPNMRRKFCILTFLWLANSVAYNGLSYNSSNLGVSDTLAFFINAIVEAPAYVLTWWAMGRWGRRWPVMLTMLLGGLACCCCMFVPEDPLWISVSLAMIGKFGIAASFGIIFLYASELLPTVVRSQAMAIASFVAGIGLLTFPYIVSLKDYARLLPMLIMGLLATAGGLCSIFLPETLGVSLPQTLEEGEEFGQNFPIWSCPNSRKGHTEKGDDLDDAESNTPALLLEVNGCPRIKQPLNI